MGRYKSGGDGWGAVVMGRYSGRWAELQHNGWGTGVVGRYSG